MVAHLLPPLRTEHDAQIARLAIPALGTLVAHPLYLLVDTAIVGHLGTDQLAGLALGSTILLTFHAVMIFLAYGTTGPVARLLASGREVQAAERSLQGLWLATILGVTGGVILYGGRHWLLGLFGATEAVLANAEIYLSISLFGLPGMLVTLAASGTFHGRQDTRTPLVIAVTGAIFSLVIEVVLIFGFGYGIGAAALSTVLAQCLTGVAGAVLLLGWIRGTGAPLGPNPGQLWALLRSGQALVLRTVALRASFTFSVVVASHIGVAHVAAHQVTLQIWGIFALILDAVAIAGQALTGMWLGTGNHDAARSATRRMVEIDVAAGVMIGVILIVFRHPLAAIFSDDVAVTSLIATVLIIVGLQQPMNGHVFALDGILIGASDFNYLAASMLLSAVIFFATAGAVWALGLGLGWLWAAIAVLMATRAVMLHDRWRRGAWLQTTI